MVAHSNFSDTFAYGLDLSRDLRMNPFDPCLDTHDTTAFVAKNDGEQSLEKMKDFSFSRS